MSNATNEPNRSATAEASDIGSLLVPSGCSGFRYLVNDGAPEEGTDIHHEGPCSIHRGDIRGDGASDELGDVRVVVASIERRRFSFVGSGAMGTVASKELSPPFCGDAGPMVWAVFDDGLCCMVSVSSLVLY